MRNGLLPVGFLSVGFWLTGNRKLVTLKTCALVKHFWTYSITHKNQSYFRNQRTRFETVRDRYTRNYTCKMSTNNHRNHSYDYDLLVIGAGSGGVRAARIAGTHGAKVGVVEKAALGGTCVNVGCIPKKLFVYSSHFSHDFEDARAYGWDVEVKNFHWKRLVENKNKVCTSCVEYICNGGVAIRKSKD